ncbi:MAG: DUF1566 domain-containing protein [Deltaproteobacteria bacterium]|nr:DUF1566 domain-containing protein [Deltaproteobacteria bacterium]
MAAGAGPGRPRRFKAIAITYLECSMSWATFDINGHWVNLLRPTNHPPHLEGSFMRKNKIKLSGFLVAGGMLACLLALSCVAGYADELPASRPSFPCENADSAAGRLSDMNSGPVADTTYAGELPRSRPPFRCECTAAGRWCDNRNGTVTDTTTGLIWLKDAGWGAFTTWYNAEWQAGEVKNGNPASLTDGSQAGQWRLPTYDELYALTNGTEAIRSSSQYLFTGLRNYYYYWTSTTDSFDPATALCVGVYGGYGGGVLP